MQTTDQVTQINVSLRYFTNLPEDVIVNTFHLRFEDGVGTLPSVTDYGNAFDNLLTFYTAIYASSQRAPWVQEDLQMKAYSLWLAPPHVPAFNGSRNLPAAPAASGATVPEMAVCLSLKADYINGIPQARQRGRIFLGGFAALPSSGTTTSFPAIGGAQQTAFGVAAAALLANMAADDWTWCILSPTQVAGSGQETFDITGGWVDNAPDTQRRRGNAPSARVVW